MRKHLGKLILGVTLVLVFGAFLIYRNIDTTIRNSYAQWWVADMVKVHLSANEQRWPKSWDDLRDDYEVCVKRSGRPWTFDELRSRVVVDWNVDVQSLKATPLVHEQVPFRVIWLRDGSSSHWSKHEPNRMIWDYLMQQEQRQTDTVLSSWPAPAT